MNKLATLPDLAREFDKMKLQGLIGGFHSTQLAQSIWADQVWTNRDQVFKEIHEQLLDCGRARIEGLFNKEIVSLLIRVYA